MSGEINTQQIHDYIQPVIAALSPGQLKKMATSIAKKMQHNNARRIRSNIDPDGYAFAPRRPQTREPKTGKMFQKLGRLRNLKRKVSAEGLEIGFFGRITHLADVHHHGLRDKVRPRLEADYAARPLLGITDQDSNDVLEVVLKQVEDAIAAS